MRLEEAEIGMLVNYKLYNDKIETGRVTSVNKSFIFVDFDNTGRGQACCPENLTPDYIAMKNNSHE